MTLGQLLAPMTQYQGIKSGWLFDPDTMEPLVNNEAMLAAMANFLELRKYTPPGPYCNLVNAQFAAGQVSMGTAPAGSGAAWGRGKRECTSARHC